MRSAGIGIIALIFTFCMPILTFAGIVGPYTGQVIDSQTGEPIRGASVLIYWLSGTPSPGGEVTHFMKANLVYTDNKGNYSSPLTLLNTGLLGYLSDTVFIVYQPGYQGHIVRIFWGPNKPFKQINNVVKLDRIPPNFDHKKHYDNIKEAVGDMGEVYESPHQARSPYDLVITWDEMIKINSQSVPLREEFLRRVAWEGRR